MSTEFQKSNDKGAANPGFRVIKSPEEKNRQAKNAISNLLAAMGSSMPQGLVSAVGGPLMAGLLAVLSCMTVVAIPAVYVGAKATGLIGSSQKSGAAMSFSKLFGNAGKNVAESALADDPDAIRALNLASEGAHPDEVTSLGLTIPEEAPGSDKNKEGDEDDEDDGAAPSKGVSITAGKSSKKMDTSKKMGDWKSNFGSSMPEGSGGSGSAGGAGGPSTALRTGKQIALGGGSGMGPAAGGSSAQNSKQGMRNSGLKLSSRKAGAYDGAKMAAGLSQQLPQVQSVDGKAGVGQAAFHGAPAAAGKAVAGGAAVVDGGVVGNPGVASINQPERAGKSNSVVPDTPSNDSEEGGGAAQAIMLMITALFAGYMLSSKVVAPMARQDTTGLSKAAAWALAVVGVAGLAAAFMNLMKAGVPQWALFLLGGLAAVVASDLIHAAATGWSWINNLFGGNSKTDAVAAEKNADRIATQSSDAYKAQLEQNIVDNGGKGNYEVVTAEDGTHSVQQTAASASQPIFDLDSAPSSLGADGTPVKLDATFSLDSNPAPAQSNGGPVAPEVTNPAAAAPDLSGMSDDQLMKMVMEGSKQALEEAARRGLLV